MICDETKVLQWVVLRVVNKDGRGHGACAEHASCLCLMQI